MIDVECENKRRLAKLEQLHTPEELEKVPCRPVVAAWAEWHTYTHTNNCLSLNLFGFIPAGSNIERVVLNTVGYINRTTGLNHMWEITYSTIKDGMRLVGIEMWSEDEHNNTTLNVEVTAYYANLYPDLGHTDMRSVKHQSIRNELEEFFKARTRRNRYKVKSK